MKCSHCSRQMKPVVAIDIDGTLGDFHTHFIEFAHAYLGLKEEVSFDMYEVTTWQSHDDLVVRGLPKYDGRMGFKKWACEAWDIDVRVWHDIKLAYRQGAQKRSMPRYPGAGELCERVRNAGAELWLTTTRPYLRLDNIDPDTRAWLKKEYIEYDGLLYDEFKYGRLAELVDKERVVVVLDDLVEMWEHAASQFGWRIPILRKQEYNRGVPSEQSVSSLIQAAIEIEHRIETWRTEHE